MWLVQHVVCNAIGFVRLGGVRWDAGGEINEPCILKAVNFVSSQLEGFFITTALVRAVKLGRLTPGCTVCEFPCTFLTVLLAQAPPSVVPVSASGFTPLQQNLITTLPKLVRYHRCHHHARNVLMAPGVLPLIPYADVVSLHCNPV
jgi:hypothetical protein